MRTKIFQNKGLNPSHGRVLLLGFFVFISLLFFAFKINIINQDVKMHKNLNAKEERKIDSIISILSLEEKTEMLHGKSFFTSEGVPRLGIRELHYTDGPFGIREELEPFSWKPLGLKTDSATFLPTGSALAATWNPELAYQYGLVMGEEAKTRGKDIILGPAVNITRSPLNGRTYEYLSEDPCLNSKLTVRYINGVQFCGIASCVKHYAANNQETNRGSINVTMDERTLREIYLPAFRAAVEDANAYGVMAAYNKFRGKYCAESDYLLNKVLKGEWNFDGMVMSDWGGTHSTVASALYGLDVEMGSDPKNIYFAKPLLDSVKAGKVPVNIINDKVRRILRVMFYSQKKGTAPKNDIVSTPEHGKTAYNIASESIVLLKNSKKLLPLNIEGIKKIAVIGDNATHKHSSEGFGAGVKARYEITPLAGLKAKIGKKADIQFVQGYKPKFQKPSGSESGMQTNNTTDPALLKEAVDAARSSDIVIMFVGTNRIYETEGTDRVTLSLPWGEDELISAVTKANANTVIVVISGAPVDLNNTEKSASAIIWSGFNGSESGNALADVLLGSINPSGKLPLSFPVSLNDSPVKTLKAVPGENTVDYSEGLLVGYRWFDTKNVNPLFCFGHGLSYTNFSYSEFKTDKKKYTTSDKVEISLKVKNTGNKAGTETVQIYVSDIDQKVFKPAKELKAFRKVKVPAGADSEVKIELPISDFAYFNEKLMKWVVVPGSYKLIAGSSSKDIRASGIITVE
jgi:beta-glucosidase